MYSFDKTHVTDYIKRLYENAGVEIYDDDNFDADYQIRVCESALQTDNWSFDEIKAYLLSLGAVFELTQYDYYFTLPNGRRIRLSAHGAFNTRSKINTEYGADVEHPSLWISKEEIDRINKLPDVEFKENYSRLIPTGEYEKKDLSDLTNGQIKTKIAISADDYTDYWVEAFKRGIIDKDTYERPFLKQLHEYEEKLKKVKRSRSNKDFWINSYTKAIDRLKELIDIDTTKIYESSRNQIGINLPNENSLGEKIIPDDDPVKLANFWNWFGNSKIVDDQGRPLVVYHGTQAEFNCFKPAKRGIYFASLKRKEEVAGYYAQDKGRILACYLKIENPFIGTPNEIYKMKEKKEKTDCDGLISINDFKTNNKFYNYQTDKLEEITLDIGDIVEIVAFDPNQIKAVNNNGLFSLVSNNIYESIEYAEMLKDGTMFEVHKNPSDKEFWDLMRNSKYKKLRALVSCDEKEKLCFVWEAYYGGTHNDILEKCLARYNQNMDHYAQVYCTEKGIEVFGFCPNWFKETYYQPTYSNDEVEKLFKELQDIFDDDDLGLLK